MAELRPLIASVARWCGKYDVSGRTVTLKLRTASYKTVTRSRSVTRPISDSEVIEELPLAGHQTSEHGGGLVEKAGQG